MQLKERQVKENDHTARACSIKKTKVWLIKLNPSLLIIYEVQERVEIKLFNFNNILIFQLYL